MDQKEAFGGIASEEMYEKLQQYREIYKAFDHAVTLFQKQL